LEDEQDQCPRRSKCVTIDVWKQIDDAINKVVDNITLADLVKNQQEKLADADQYMI
jgi:DNA-binding IscR family transcriptional regulator